MHCKMIILYMKADSICRDVLLQIPSAKCEHSKYTMLWLFLKHILSSSGHWRMLDNNYTRHKKDEDESGSESVDDSCTREAFCLRRLIAKRSSSGSSSRSADWSTDCFLGTTSNIDEGTRGPLPASLAKAIASRSKIC